MYNVLTKIKKELEDFTTSIEIVPSSIKENNQTVKYLTADTDSYDYNQKDTIDRIDRYYNSQYETGSIDSEGQRKAFLNIVKFHADVAAKQTDVDVKDFLFIPETRDDVDKVWLFQKDFTIWAREKQYGEVINELNIDYSKYGTCVGKQVGDDFIRVPLRNLMNTQDAKTLDDAVESGGYVIEKHKMSPRQMRQMPDWDLEGLELDEDKTYTIYERYSYCPKGVIDGTEDDEQVLTMSIIYLGAKNENDSILFIEEVDQLPYEEAHWSKQDGRWLGLGEVEIQFENQIARNITANLRRRNLLWGSKKLFQSSDTDMVGKNLVKEVADGDVLEVGPAGAISMVNTQSQHGVDYNADDAVWNDNSRQKSFNFEVATGETMPSGTPFRLGVILANSTQTHFNLKRENFGFFLERAYFEKQVPIFKKKRRSKEYVLTVAMGEDGITRYKNAMLIAQANKRLKEKILGEDLVRTIIDGTLDFDFDTELEKVKSELADEPYMFIKIGPKIYDDIHYKMELTITGEEVPIEKRMETLTSLFQVLPPDDPRRDEVLSKILSLAGIDSGGVLGKRQQQNPAMAQMMGGGDLSALTNINANQEGTEGLAPEVGE